MTGESGKPAVRKQRRPPRQRAELAGEASAAAAGAEQPPAVPDPTAAAFFDVDNTLMRGASLYHFARGLAARGMFGPRDLARLTLGQLAFRMRGSENADHIDAAREAALAFVAGHRVADIVKLGEEIYDDTMADRIWEGTRELTQRHLQAGQRVWLVTATPVELANILARRLGLTGALGTVSESADGVYTGRLVGGLLHGDAKAAAVRALARREGLDLAGAAPTATRSTTCRCCSSSGTRTWSTRTRTCWPRPRTRNWPVHDFRTGRKTDADRAAGRGRRGRGGRRRGGCARAAPPPGGRLKRLR